MSFSLTPSSYMCVHSITWSDMPCSVSGSCSTLCAGSVARMRSIHDCFVPFWYVQIAGGPGWMPFKIYHFCYSHISITHCALVPTMVSKLCLAMELSPIFGCSVPTRAFQSPHITDRACGGNAPIMSSMSVLAVSSSMPRVWRFVAGGRYTFPIQISSPPYPYMLTPCAYSLPTYFSTLIPFFISIAIPPLLSAALRSS
jgi:hypothetical protein